MFDLHSRRDRTGPGGIFMHPDPDRLLRVPLFAGLSVDERKRLAREGASDYEFFVLDEGTVRVVHEGRTLRELGPGDVFGEVAFFREGRRSADVVAETNVRVLSMFGSRFRKMQISMPEVAARLQDLVRERTRAVEPDRPDASRG